MYVSFHLFGYCSSKYFFLHCREVVETVKEASHIADDSEVPPKSPAGAEEEQGMER